MGFTPNVAKVRLLCDIVRLLAIRAACNLTYRPQFITEIVFITTIEGIKEHHQQGL